MSIDVEVRLAIGETPRVVGRLLDVGRGIFFEYDPAFLKSGLEISPFRLPLSADAYVFRDPAFLGLPGVFHDALPDGFGLQLMHERMRQAGVEPMELSVLSWLRHLGERAMGALTFHPVEGSLETRAIELKLRSLARQAQEVVSGKARTVLPELELAGGSPGGARPKVVVAIGPDDELVAGAARVPPGFEHWLIKFAAKADAPDMGRLEETYAQLARAGGIDMSETRLFALGGKRVAFGTRRFDRLGNERIHMHTIGGLLHISHRTPSLDYKQILVVTSRLVRDQTQVLEAFRRAAFNVLSANRDDHAHNFSYLMDARGVWRFSPAYDLTPSDGVGEHTTAVLGHGRPGRSQLIQLAEVVGLKPSDAEAALKKVERAVDAFPKVAKEVGVTATTLKRVQKRLEAVRRDYA